MSASSPRNVLPVLVSHPSWQVARASGESVKQATTNGMRKKARKGERFVKFLNGRVVVFISARFCLFCSPHGNDKVISGRIGRRDRTRSGVKQRAAMRCGFAQVKLCADFLDERFLLLQFRFESINF